MWHLYNTTARVVVPRQNNDMKHRIYITKKKKKKLDCYAKNFRGKNTSVIHDAMHPIQLLL